MGEIVKELLGGSRPIENGLANRRARSAPWKWLRRLLATAAGIVVLAVVLIYFRAPILTALAKAWVVNDALTHADAIVVLGGGPDTRPFEAAARYHQGLAPKVLYMDVRIGPAGKLVPEDLTEQEFTHRILLRKNVPENALEVIGRQVTNTRDESLAVKAWVEKTGAKSIIIATDLFHTRRARWIFRRALRDERIGIQMDATPMLDYDITNWWRHEDGLIAFETEFVKTLYYHIKY